VICEVMRDDGTMARLDDLIPFAQKHKLKIGTIRDLIAYRRRNDHMIERRAENSFTSKWGGEWRAISFYNKAAESETIALVKGHISPESPTLERMHQISFFADIFGEDSPRSALLQNSMKAIGEAGSGVVVLINRPQPDRFSRIMRVRNSGGGENSRTLDELRDYGVGAQILAELGVHDMILLTNSRINVIALDGYDLSVIEERAIPLD
jgi:3,4-dihydroxy 2-butanone 4-phosphate synthase/GTP cyclohydrolase II